MPLQKCGIGIDLLASPIFFEGFGVFALFAECAGPVQLGSFVLGIEREGVAAFLDRFVVPAVVVERDGPVRPVAGTRWAELHGLCVALVASWKRPTLESVLARPA